MADNSNLKVPKAAAETISPTPPFKINAEGSKRRQDAQYWKGRPFPPKAGSRRAQIVPKRTTSNAPADLRPRMPLPPVVADLGVASSRATDTNNDKQLDLVAALQEFEQFKEALLPALQQDVKGGLTAQEIMQKYQSVAAARLVSLLPSMNPKFAASAATQILDRTLGKAVERKAIAHQFQDLSEKELDALIISTLQDDEDAT